MKRSKLLTAFFILLFIIGIAYAADIVPTDIQQPGTQPLEVGNLESPDKCDNCHGGYNTSVEPAFNWRGSMMAGAGRDPIFWATLAIAEQDFDGAGDLCIRCHSTAGWLAGRSTPTDGSGLAAGDADGVECEFCHKATNPDDSEHVGVQNAPFVANDGSNPAAGYYGSGMASIWPGSDKLGPYPDAEARHQFMPSDFHRSKDFCGMCHDVSNPAVGNLAHNHGTQDTADIVVADNTLGGEVDGKAAFNNLPFIYGIVERTFSEHNASEISKTLISDYSTFPEDLKSGALDAIYNAAQAAGTSGNYEDGTPRYFTCQSCHMRPITGKGCNKKGAPIRADLPLHDMTGGNYWMPDAIQYLDAVGKLRLGGGLTTVQIDALNAGKLRAMEQLNLAATLSVQGNTVKIVNHTGHKLISGYPEGRRMWLNIKWYDDNNNLLREDGEYGPIGVTFPDPEDPSQVIDVESIINLNDPNTKIYEAHYGMTKEWANQLIGLGYDTGLPLGFDRINGDADYTLGELAGQSSGMSHETFHFVLNNTVVKDNRIPPYGFDYEQARIRNALPVPAHQYGNPGSSGTYDYWDEVSLNLPSGAKSATIDLLYQPTSWEYIQFLYLANNRQNDFLNNEGAYMLEAWLATGMAAPYVMASTTWRDASVPECNAPVPILLSAEPSSGQVIILWNDEHTTDPRVMGYKVYYDQAGKSQFIIDVGLTSEFNDTSLNNGQEYCYKITSLYDCDGDEAFDLESDFSNILCAIPNAVGQLDSSVEVIEPGKWVTQGKGKNKTTSFVITTDFSAGDTVIIRAYVIDAATGLSLSNASVDIDIAGPETATLETSSSDSDGIAEAIWQTESPNRKGQGGTTPGQYTATITNVTASGYTWDGVMTSTGFSIN